MGQLSKSKDNKSPSARIAENKKARFDYAIEDGEFKLNSAGLLRTARRLFKGFVSIPEI